MKLQTSFFNAYLYVHIFNGVVHNINRRTYKKSHLNKNTHTQLRINKIIIIKQSENKWR